MQVMISLMFRAVLNRHRQVTGIYFGRGFDRGFGPKGGSNVTFM
jgi:hypothetical protein